MSESDEHVDGDQAAAVRAAEAIVQHEQKLNPHEIKPLASSLYTAFLELITRLPEAQQAVAANFRLMNGLEIVFEDPSFEHQGHQYSFLFGPHRDRSGQGQLFTITSSEGGIEGEKIQIAAGKSGNDRSVYSISYSSPDSPVGQPSQDTVLAFNRANRLLKRLGGQEISRSNPNPVPPQI